MMATFQDAIHVVPAGMIQKCVMRRMIMIRYRKSQKVPEIVLNLCNKQAVEPGLCDKTFYVGLKLR